MNPNEGYLAVHIENAEFTAYPCIKDGSSALNYEVSALACYSNLLFVGSKSGVVIEYLFEEQDGGETVFSYVELISRKICESKIFRLEPHSSLNLILIFYDDCLLLCDGERLEPVNSLPLFRGVSTFCLALNVAERSQLCVGYLGRCVQLYTFQADYNLHLTFETKVSSVPRLLCVSDNFICVATDEAYQSVNLNTKQVNPLFTISNHHTESFIRTFCKDQFFIPGPSGLGLIVDASGASQKEPIQMSPNVLDVFVLQSYVFTITDEFFIIHNLVDRCQLQTVHLPISSAACFSPHMLLSFVATSPKNPDGSSGLLAVAPERWDRLARKLILVECIQDAKNIILYERKRIEKYDPSVLNTQKQLTLFNVRYRRVCGLLGLYYFEKAIFSEAAKYFEKSCLNIQELLCRYDKLLPEGYLFQPNPYFYFDDQPKDTAANSYSLVRGQVHRLCETRVAEKFTSDDETDQVDNLSHQVDKLVCKYEMFLFDFLQKHRKSWFTYNYVHLLETALVKLYIKLIRRGIRPVLSELIFAPDTLSSRVFDCAASYGDGMERDATSSHELVNLISSLAHIDVDDLVDYLEKSSAPHALALVYNWQGNVSKALEIWRQLAYGELEDDGTFPGVEFYLKVLRWLASPTSDEARQSSGLVALQPAEVSQEELPGIQAYSELILQHLNKAVDSGHRKIAKAILLSLPANGFHLLTASSSPVDGREDPDLAPSQALSPAVVLHKLSTGYPSLARHYLHSVICRQGDVNTTHHDLLTKLYLDAIMELRDYSGTRKEDIPTDSVQCDKRSKLLRLRREFCSFLRHSSHYTADRLRERLCSPTYSWLVPELALVMGRLDNHVEALELLLNNSSNVSSALSYCLSYLPVVKPGQKQTPLEDSPSNVAARLFTSLIKLCIEKSSQYYEGVALTLLNCPEIPLKYAEVFSVIPGHWPIVLVQAFLRRGLRTHLAEESTCIVQLSLARRAALVAAATLSQLTQGDVRRVVRQEVDTLCNRCRNPLDAFGAERPFVWLLAKGELVHAHCLAPTTAAGGGRN